MRGRVASRARARTATSSRTQQRLPGAERALRGLVYPLTLLTGAAGLVYEITWQRYLVRLLGSDTLATAAVLGVFLGGLSLGYFLCGRWTLRLERLLPAYAALEAGIGLWALGFPWLFAGVEQATRSWSFAPPIGLALQGGVCAVVLIGAPTVCMGATVPMLTRGLTRSLAEATPVHARIYAANTAGAGAGALVAGFLLIEQLGLPATLRWTAALNLIAAGCFAWLGWRLRADRPRPSDRARDAERTRGESLTAGRRRALAAVAFLGGVYFMTLESLLVRVTNLTLGSSSYSFALVVAVFVLCVALGAFVVGRRATIPRTALVANQVAVGGSLLVLFATLDAWPWAAHLLRIAFSETPSAMVLYYATAFAGLSLVLAVPVGCMGATLPLVFHMLRRDVERVGATAGRVFAWNALGNLVGGLVGGYLVFFALGIGAVFLAATTLVALGAWLAAVGCGVRRPVAPALLTALVAGCAWIFPYQPLRFAVGTFRVRAPLEYSYASPERFYREFYGGRQVLAYRDDPEGTFAVVENPPPLEAMARRFPNLSRSLRGRSESAGIGEPAPRSIQVNGKSDSNTWFDRETLRLAAHLPALLAERRERALVVGLGTGVTAGELALYPDVVSIEVAEISRAVVDFLPWFAESNHSVHDEPRLRLRIGDAFRVIAREKVRWDIVSSEPSNPWVVGVDQLFSREFYRAVREHLADDGLFVQWVQRYATNERIFALVVQTLDAEFPHLRLFRIPNADDLLLASLRPIEEADFTRAQVVLQGNAEVRRSLAAIGVAGVADLLALEDAAALERARQRERVGVETLDRPRLHYWSGRAFFRGDGPGAEN